MKSIIHALFLTVGFGLVSSHALAHCKEFKPEFVATLIPAYLEVQTSLAGDNLASARTATQSLLATAAQGPAFAAMTEPVNGLIAAPDIATARKYFQAISVEMISLLDHVGTTGSQKLFVAHCPMAFGGKGGDWLQADKKVNNPYYGSMMLRCGSIKQQILGRDASTTPKNVTRQNDGVVPAKAYNSVALNRIHAGVNGYQTQSDDQVQAEPEACGMSCCASAEN
jgi:hypothetical protein